MGLLRLPRINPAIVDQARLGRTCEAAGPARCGSNRNGLAAAGGFVLIAMAKVGPNIVAHLEWLGFVKPTGLVVSPPILVRAGAILNRYDRDGQRLLRECIAERAFGPEGSKLEPYLPSFRIFAETVLDWSFSPKAFAGTEEYPIPDELKVQLPTSNTIIQPHYAIRERDSIRNPTDYDGAKWQLLVRMVNTGEDLDRVARTGSGIDASPHGMLERLLRETGVSAGLLFNGTTLRLVSAPRRESSGWLDFRVSDMVQAAGRPISSALRLLLRQPRLLTLPSQQRLTALLANSRKFQTEVSEKLAEQVLQALYELLRGFQAAHDASKGELLRIPLGTQPDDVYRGLLTVILRIVFLLYAEERDMLPHQDETFSRYYSIAGLYERLREDAAEYPDTMDQRYGGWSQLIALFRMIHDGAQAGESSLPARRGVLFDPVRFPFLESLQHDSDDQSGSIQEPLVPDGIIYRLLEKLLVLDGERISYRTLDVEHIGSVYENMMGFRLEASSGWSVAIIAAKKGGAPSTINLEELLAEASRQRHKWIRDRTYRKIATKVSQAVRVATTLGEVHAALDSVIDKNATPDLVPAGAMVLQPSPERRRSGSHFTPPKLTKPIVEKALAPVLDQIRLANAGPPRPNQILDIKVCDPAVGSGAFLVESCRYLADELIVAWRADAAFQKLASSDDELALARRRVALSCLYGVDHNPVAVDLTKLSLCLLTLSKDDELPFLDHAIRHGDSMVGLSFRQVDAFHWDGDKPNFQEGLELMKIRENFELSVSLQEKMRHATESDSYFRSHDLWTSTKEAQAPLRFYANLITSAFFYSSRKGGKESKRIELSQSLLDGTAWNCRHQYSTIRYEMAEVKPFHWMIEFPDIFARRNPGFDVIVGNPPFRGGRNLSAEYGDVYLQWLRTLHKESSGSADLVAYFFRRSFDLIRTRGTFGLIATNTIAQGDTRSTGLKYICNNGGTIYGAETRKKWPGLAAVVISVVHISKGGVFRSKLLDKRRVDKITAFLSYRGSNEDPLRLSSNKNRSFQGSIVLGMGFTFDDYTANSSANSLEKMNDIVARYPSSMDVIYPYIGGEEVNTTPTHRFRRYVINFGERSEEECKTKWPALYKVLEERVKPERVTKDPKKYPRMVNEWWKFWNPRTELQYAIKSLKRVIVINCGATPHHAFTFLPSTYVYANTLAVVSDQSYQAFCILQSRIHEVWARFFGSSLEDRLRYTPSDCFETFPFPDRWTSDIALGHVGENYHHSRASLMVDYDEGLTKTYNRFHNPDETDQGIPRLRELHEAMDRAVLEAYGWTDISTECEFLLDYEIEGGGGRRNLTATDGPTMFGTRSSVACSNSTPNVPPRRSGLVSRQRRRVGSNRQPATRPQLLEGCFHDARHACRGKPTRDPCESVCAAAPTLAAVCRFVGTGTMRRARGGFQILDTCSRARLQEHRVVRRCSVTVLDPRRSDGRR